MQATAKTAVATTDRRLRDPGTRSCAFAWESGSVCGVSPSLPQQEQVSECPAGPTVGLKG